MSDTPASTLRKWALKLCMATSAAFHRWRPGNTNSMSNLCVSQMWFFMFLDTLLSRTCFFGTMPTRFSHWRSVSYACIISTYLQLFMGSLRMALLSISTITMIYLLPCCNCIGNWPVWLENMVLHTLYVLVGAALENFPPQNQKNSSKLHILSLPHKCGITGYFILFSHPTKQVPQFNSIESPPPPAASYLLGGVELKGK